MTSPTGWRRARLCCFWHAVGGPLMACAFRLLWLWGVKRSANRASWGSTACPQRHLHCTLQSNREIVSCLPGPFLHAPSIQSGFSPTLSVLTPLWSDAEGRPFRCSSLVHSHCCVPFKSSHFRFCLVDASGSPPLIGPLRVLRPPYWNPVNQAPILELVSYECQKVARLPPGLRTPLIETRPMSLTFFVSLLKVDIRGSPLLPGLLRHPNPPTSKPS
jgi:hypothetical protein